MMSLLKKYEAIFTAYIRWATVDWLRDEHLTQTSIKACPPNSILETREKVSISPSLGMGTIHGHNVYHMKDVTLPLEGEQNQHAQKSRDKT